MGPIVDGAIVGTFVTTAIQLGQSATENTRGIKEKFIVFTVKNKKSFLSKPCRVLLFDSDAPGLYEQLKPFASEIDPNTKRRTVDMVKLKTDTTGVFKELDEMGLFSLQGGTTVVYKFRKGLCYANDASGNRTTDKNGNPVQRDSVEVFAQVNYFEPTENGGMRTHYVSGFDPNIQGARIENTFFREAVAIETASTSVMSMASEEVVAEEITDPGF